MPSALIRRASAIDRLASMPANRLSISLKVLLSSASAVADALPASSARAWDSAVRRSRITSRTRASWSFSRKIAGPWGVG